MSRDCQPIAEPGAERQRRTNGDGGALVGYNQLQPQQKSRKAEI